MKIFAVLLVLSLTGGGAWAQGNMEAEAQRNLGETKEVAARALTTFQEIGKQKNFKTLGFDSAEQLSEARLGEPIAVMMVGLEDLRGYKAGTDPNAIVKPIGKVIYPVSTNERVRSSIVVQKAEKGWQASDFGGANFARLVTEARERTAKATSQPSNSFFLVQVPALNVYFIGYLEEGKLMLSSIIDDPKMNLRAGNPLPAEQIFTELSTVAQNYNGLPM
jgi:hypothetical protein